MMFYRYGLNKVAIVHFPEKPFLYKIIFSCVMLHFHNRRLGSYSISIALAQQQRQKLIYAANKLIYVANL